MKDFFRNLFYDEEGFLDGLIGAAGSIFSGILGYKGQQDTNETNVNLQNSANSVNIAEAQKNRDFQAQMSNSAYQRSRADMEAAGLNPMLMASMGGSSTPSGSTASAGAAHVDNSLSELGTGIGRAVPSALQVMQTKKGLEASDAAIKARNAEAVSSLAAAANSNASAKATESRMPSFMEEARSARARADADISEAGARSAKASYDTSYAGIDAAISRAANAIAIPSSAVNIKRMWEGSKSDTQRRSEYLEKQGIKGARIK